MLIYAYCFSVNTLLVTNGTMNITYTMQNSKPPFLKIPDYFMLQENLTQVLRRFHLQQR
jgi:hypothetical protein